MPLINPLKLLTLPPYLFRPRQALVRLGRRRPAADAPPLRLHLPWGDPIQARPGETIGAQIYYYGVFDLTLCEALARLVDPGERCLDIGANIGQMTLLLRAAVGHAGQVVAFEPHPGLFEELQANVGRTDATPGNAPVIAHPVALSDEPGTGRLSVGGTWDANRGVAALGRADSADGDSVDVPLRRLDDLFPGGETFGVWKVDVEGHERHVFAGASALLQRRAVRDIVYEEIGGESAPTHDLLRSAGYRLFRIEPGLLRPKLSRWDDAGGRSAAFADNYLATLAPERAEDRFRSIGWRALSSRLRPRS